ncbi:MAG: cellulose synthase/poly-beta-1,6-N-acetylglucosamine synthase-like glycosyltransferase [Flavobacterium sp.]|jgi:cellulose synthase/poly-beta-1,6-N-acetylglucosamine synthase-like glycosyltransferase
MIIILSYIVLFFYSLAIILIFLYGLAQFNLLINYYKSKKILQLRQKWNFSEPEDFPLVTIQLPIFNEKYVVNRLLNSIAKIEYPIDKLQIQVLDDSTDDSIIETKAIIKKLQNSGLNITHHCRKNRIGFKAGALKEGLITATGEFIAVFDADFVPKSDWLLQTIPYFKDEKIGVIQTRWTHLNRDYSLLTKIQAFALDAHFTLEQTGRNSKKHFINFNGTAGVWRKECIYDAGNWESDTLTEDLDLSYRAQLKKWEFIYLEDVETPAELPAIISAARSQQFRWNKGGAENFVKNIKKVLLSDIISAKTKFHGFLHLLNSSMFLCIFAMAILSVPILLVKTQLYQLDFYFDFMAFFILTSILFFISYWYSYQYLHGRSFKNFIKFTGLFFIFYSIAMGFSFQNSIAVLEGLFGKKSEFVRTPKFNIEALKERWKENIYISKTISRNTIIEALLILYFMFGIGLGFYLNDYGLVPFHLMLIIGYSYIVVQSVKQ